MEPVGIGLTRSASIDMMDTTVSQRKKQFSDADGLITRTKTSKFVTITEKKCYVPTKNDFETLMG